MKKLLLKLSGVMLLFFYCSILPASAQDRRTVGGVVTEESTDDPIPGVSVREKGTNNGTVTDVDGNFSIRLTTESPVLVFSFIGLKTQEIGVGNATNIDVALVDDLSNLQEVVVVGYGEQKKESITSAVSTVQSRDISKVAAATVSATLAGKLPGVAFRQAEGRPGSGAQINIRNMGNPLFVIDGIQKDQGQFNNLSPQDIESITVLKDAAASVYGSRAANGVIIVTTKRGSRGQKPTINLDAYYGGQS
jgi:TonB-dependent SusC/RagA subfamily outer membrane receptor